MASTNTIFVGHIFFFFFFFFFFFSWARPVLKWVVFCGFVVPGAPEGSVFL